MTEVEISKILSVINKPFHRSEDLYNEILSAKRQPNTFETKFQGINIKVTNQYILFCDFNQMTYVKEDYLDKYLKFLDYFARSPDILELDIIKFGSIQDHDD